MEKNRNKQTWQIIIIRKQKKTLRKKTNTVLLGRQKKKWLSISLAGCETKRKYCNKQLNKELLRWSVCLVTRCFLDCKHQYNVRRQFKALLLHKEFASVCEVECTLTFLPADTFNFVYEAYMYGHKLVTPKNANITTCSTAVCVYIDEGGSISWWSDTQLLTKQWDAQTA